MRSTSVIYLKKERMKLMRFYAIAVLLVFANILVGQEQEYQFNHFKSLGGNNVVYIKIADLSNDEDEQLKVLSVLLSDENIYDGQIYSNEQANPTCQIEVSHLVNVSYVRSLLQSVGYDIDLTSVASNQNGKPKGVYSSKRYYFMEGFDGMKGYDPNVTNAGSSEDYYAKSKEDYIKQNHEEYEKAKAANATQVIVTKKDLEFFKEEKRQHILSHPEIYIIQD